MNRLIKAEWYRLMKSRGVLKWIIIGTVVYTALPVFYTIGHWDEELSTLLMNSSPIFLFVLMVLPPAYALVTGKLYNKGKQGYYEIMAGNDCFKIVFSKLLTEGLLLGSLCSFAVVAFYAVCAIRNGVGGLDHILIRMLLYVVIFVHIAFGSVLIALCTRNPGSGAVCCYLRFLLFDMAGIPFLSWIAGTVLGFDKAAFQIAHLSLMNKMQMLFSEALSIRLVLHILLGFVLEVLFWYAIIYRGMKKRKF